MDVVFEPLATTLGASLDQIKLIFCLLLSFPLASVYARVKSPLVKHLFSIAVSAFYLLAVFNLWTGTLHLVLSTFLTYVIAALVPGSTMPWIVFVLVMGDLTLNHLHRALNDISLATFEITGPQMVLTMKLTTFAWNVHDGRQSPQSLDKWQQEKKVVQMPNILEFFGYAFYFPGVLVGPYLEFANYSNLVHGFAPLGTEQKPRYKDHPQLPAGRNRAAFWRMLQGFVWLALFVLYGGRFSYSVILSDWWQTIPWWYQFVYLQICGTFERAKYYAIWRLTEGSAIATGLGFTGYTIKGKPKWDGAANVNISAIEIPANFKLLLDSWNIKTNIWLRECIYKRVTPKGKKPGFVSSFLTFMTSAFWHGFAWGYYLTFLLGGFIQSVQRSVRTLVRPLLFSPVVLTSAERSSALSVKRLYDLLGTLATVLIINYATVPFVLGSIEDSIEGWRRLHWYGHLMIVGALVFFWGPGGVWLKQQVKIPAQNASSPTPKLLGLGTPVAQMAPPLELAAEGMMTYSSKVGTGV